MIFKFVELSMRNLLVVVLCLSVTAGQAQDKKVSKGLFDPPVAAKGNRYFPEPEKLIMVRSDGIQEQKGELVLQIGKKNKLKTKNKDTIGMNLLNSSSVPQVCTVTSQNDFYVVLDMEGNRIQEKSSSLEVWQIKPRPEKQKNGNFESEFRVIPKGFYCLGNSIFTKTSTHIRIIPLVKDQVFTFEVVRESEP